MFTCGILRHIRHAMCHACASDFLEQASGGFLLLQRHGCSATEQAEHAMPKNSPEATTDYLSS